MRKLMTALALAGLVALSGAAGAEDMTVPGLGTLPFRKEVSVTDGSGTAVEGMLRRSLSGPAKARTKRTELMRFLTMPGGMRVAGEGADSPAARARLYQLVRERPSGMYTMTAVVFSGSADELFGRGKQKEKEFWDEAFRKGGMPEGRVQTLITLDEFREAVRRAADGFPGDAADFRILEASPWKAYRNGDGTVRWQQNVKFVITAENGLLAPLWMESVLFRNPAGRYYFLIFTGSHESGRQLADDLLYALYQLRREKL